MSGDLLPIYEHCLAETVDDYELFVWWRETRRREANLWARLLPDNLAVELFDARVRSVAAVAVLPSDSPTLAALVPVPAWRETLRQAAREWTPLPVEWRRQTALNVGLRGV